MELNDLWTSGILLTAALAAFFPDLAAVALACLAAAWWVWAIFIDDGSHDQ